MKAVIMKVGLVHAGVTAAMLVALSGVSPAKALDQRCGWYMNPTPGNLLLFDKDDHWWITSQMQGNGPDAEGSDDKAPRFDSKQYVQTQPNGYGYGCACLNVDADAKNHRITKVYSGRTIPIAKCKGDKTLPKPDM
jgi:hypothetical protein